MEWDDMNRNLEFLVINAYNVLVSIRKYIVMIIWAQDDVSSMLVYITVAILLEMLGMVAWELLKWHYIY